MIGVSGFRFYRWIGAVDWNVEKISRIVTILSSFLDEKAIIFHRESTNAVIEITRKFHKNQDLYIFKTKERFCQITDLHQKYKGYKFFYKVRNLIKKFTIFIFFYIDRLFDKIAL